MSRQWLSLVVAIWLQCISGTNSNFPAYSSQLKHLLSMSQLQLNNLAFASDAGKILAWFSGVAAVHLPLWLVLVIGSIIGMIGYGVQYLILTSHISSDPPYWLVFLLTVVAGNSICWINTVCYIIIIRNFPLDRQVALGLSTSYQGLSAKIYGDIVDAVFYSSSPAERAKGYLLLNSILPVVVCMVAAPLIADINTINVGRSSRKLSAGFIVMFIITIATGTYAVISSSLGSKSKFSQLIILIGVGALIMIFPLVVPVAEKIRETLQKKCWIRNQRKVCTLADTVEDDEMLRSSSSVDQENIGPVKERDIINVSEVGVMEDIGVKLMLKKVEFWLYFFVYLFGATVGMVYLNNLGQIAESRGYSRASSLVALSSSFCFFGRLIPSLLENYRVTRTKYIMCSRAASMAVMMALMSGAFFLLESRSIAAAASSSSLSLNISTAIIGICTGAISSMAVSTTTELFGTKGFGVNHNILIINIPIGSFLFGDLAALLYRNHTTTKTTGEGSKCLGTKCYQTTFIIWGSLCFMGTLLALILHARTRKFYAQI